MNSKIMELLREETKDRIEPGKLLIELKQCETARQVREQVNNFSFSSGWLCLTDRVVALYSPADLAGAQDGVILSGELANGGESLHIRQAENGWTLTSFKTGQGEACLVCDEEYISTENQQQARLKYQVCWRLHNDSYRPWAARFTGLEKGGADNE